MKVLRFKKVSEATGLPRSTVYLYMRLGKFPKPVKLGIRSVGWIESEIQDWLRNKSDSRLV